ncbi:MAG TPA: phosphoglucomutase/phosphomannomutase family protein [Nitrospirota bacterium]|nr:phosphoglucomutase/phosphomannomutase family protein [Nitrospirota bacterium]
MTTIKFGTSGWRDIISEGFTSANVRIVTQAIADYVNGRGEAGKGMIVGYDTRFQSEYFAEIAARVLAGNGIKAYLSDRDVPTPAVSFEILRRKTAGGINITASHNPPEYSGMKFSPDWGGPALPETTKEIEERANALMINPRVKDITLDEAKYRGLIEEIDIARPYLDDLKKKINFSVIEARAPRVALDPLYGTARGYLDAILKGAGIEVTVLHDHRDPYFGGHRPEPAEEYLEDLIRVVVDGSYDIGLATDGDADRFGLVDEGGEFITPNEFIALAFDYLVRARGLEGGVARGVATTHLIDRVAALHGREVYETPVGFKYIGELISEGKIVVGGEESAGMTIKGHVPEKDGILACLLALEMVCAEGMSLRKQIDRLFDKSGKVLTRRLNIALTDALKEKLKTKLAASPAAFGDRKVVKTVTLDGHKFILDDGSWILMRLSGTEPVVRIYVEANSADELMALSKEGERFITK